MTKPKYSVLIPTRERAVTLVHALRTLTSQNYDSLEIVISDNCSTDDTRAVVEAADDPRVKYVRTDGRVSMSHNWEFGLSKCTGDWISVIGDDDGFLPGAFPDLDELLSEYQAEAIVSRHCSYIWPSSAQPHGLIAVPLGNGERWRTSANVRDDVLAGRADYTDLPIIYNGTIVSRSAIEKTRSRDGTFFGSCIPDVFSGLALSCVLEKYLFSELPVAINGASKFSTGTSQLNGSKNSTVENSPAQVFAREGNLPFHPSVPMRIDGGYPPSITALILECYLRTRERFPYLAEPDLEFLNALIMARAGTHFEELEEWSQRFRKVNNLDSRPRDLSVTSNLSMMRAARVLRRISRAVDTYVLDGDRYPASNVYEAALVARQVRANPPPKLTMLGRKVLRKALR